MSEIISIHENCNLLYHNLKDEAESIAFCPCNKDYFLCTCHATIRIPANASHDNWPGRVTEATAACLVHGQDDGRRFITCSCSHKIISAFIECKHVTCASLDHCVWGEEGGGRWRDYLVIYLLKAYSYRPVNCTGWYITSGLFTKSNLTEVEYNTNHAHCTNIKRIT